MTISIFELFSIGVGPSSSHTVGPMRAANAFLDLIKDKQAVTRVQVDLYGSLALTGHGHATDKAVLMGLEGELPHSVDPQLINNRVNRITQQETLNLNQEKVIQFFVDRDLLFHRTESLPYHSNAMRIRAYQDDKELAQETYYSIGGGFIVDDATAASHTEEPANVPFPFTTAAELFQHCQQQKCDIKDIMLVNEQTWRDDKTIRASLLNIHRVMDDCIEQGCKLHGNLPGDLNIKRRAPGLRLKLEQKPFPRSSEESQSLNWLNLYAIAVNEENATGGRVVTAPTNGAAGIIPAVLRYYLDFHPETSEEDTINFLLTAGAIALLYKHGASLSAAEVGCQGEVGVACSMAAAALTAVLGGTLEQVENAAEIGMEHNLGLTCDPIHGLVQIPCIERNAMGAVKAVNASQLALLEEGKNFVTLDSVINTMKQTGRDMMTIYKETSQGGLAVNIPEC